MVWLKNNKVCVMDASEDTSMIIWSILEFLCGV